MNMQEATSIMKADSYKMAALSEDTRNNILVHVKDALIAHKDEIFAANAKDMAAAEENGIAASVKKRLKFDEHKLADVTNGIDELIKLPDPVGQIQLKRELDEGLVRSESLLPYRCHRNHIRGKTGCAGPNIIIVHQERQLRSTQGWQGNCQHQQGSLRCDLQHSRCKRSTRGLHAPGKPAQRDR